MSEAWQSELLVHDYASANDGIKHASWRIIKPLRERWLNTYLLKLHGCSLANPIEVGFYCYEKPCYTCASLSFAWYINHVQFYYVTVL